MGTWAEKPWDNDAAADYFGSLMGDTGFAARVIDTLEDSEASKEEHRAAASMVVLLGRVYVWPIDDYEDTLRLAVHRLDEMLVADAEETRWRDPYVRRRYREQVAEERDILKARLRREPDAQPRHPRYWEADSDLSL